MAGQDGTIGKALQVLERVAEKGRPVRFAELLSEGGFPKATLYRLLQTLVSQGMLEHDPETGAYGLGLRLVRLAHGAWASASLAPLARKHIESLAAKTGKVVHLAQIESGQVLYVDKIGRPGGADMFSATGRVGPAYCTGVGKAMLAHLSDRDRQAALDRQSFHRFTPFTLDREALEAEMPEIRAEGVAWDREEHEAGIVCLAARQDRRGGRVLGAASITSTLAEGGLEGLMTYRQDIIAMVRAIAEETHAWRFPDLADTDQTHPVRRLTWQR